ncbi:transposase [Fictibacillus arsenicus]|uniref:Transposase n=1 Tax=Fictibacillus arsenicus TaxID=255247 RepID=A0A177GZP0_9BACL|nr:IS1182 family transposase [Fictibacillus arsenicus]ANX13435.1 transposase [Fictibacillus arsenicus]ANX14164.1 transposase [Fictibacillus arsenicus]
MKHDHISFIDYNMDQLTLPMDISELIPLHNVARVVNEMIERIPDEHFLKYYPGGGRSTYHPKMMTKVLVYAYTQRMYSGREIAHQLTVHLPLIWLSGFQTPDFRTINRFRSERLKGLIDDLFKQVLVLLVEEGQVQLESYFLDGTKIEANANRYTFVWKKSTEKYKEKLEGKVEELITQIDGVWREEASCEDKEKTVISPEKIQNKVDEWEEKLEKEPKNKELKKAVKVMKKDYLPRSLKYKKQLSICGDRKSFSKTDPDATFMRMKEDHMKNGQLKPGYNVQMASNNQFILSYTLHQRPGDTRCLIPHLQEVKAKFDIDPKRIIADAGYGSEENYAYLEGKKQKAYIKYGLFEKEQKRSFKKNPHHQSNWFYDVKKDTFTCAAGKLLYLTGEKKQKTESGYESTIKVYKCNECEGCPFRKECTTSKDGRSTQVNETYQELKSKAKKRLWTDEGKQLYARRKIDIESVFGQFKGNRSFRRFSLRGLPKVNIEVGLISLAHNLLKSAAKKAA